MKWSKGLSESSTADEVVIQNNRSQSEKRKNHHVSEESTDSNNNSVASDGSDDSEIEPFENKGTFQRLNYFSAILGSTVFPFSRYTMATNS